MTAPNEGPSVEWWTKWLTHESFIAKLHKMLFPEVNLVQSITVVVKIGHDRNAEMAKATLHMLQEEAKQQSIQLPHWVEEMIDSEEDAG